MKLDRITIFIGIGLLVFGITFVLSPAGIERITIGIPTIISGVVIVGIIAMLKSKKIRNFPI